MSGTPVNTERERRFPASENVAAPEAASMVLHIRPDQPGRIAADRSTQGDRHADSVGVLLESSSLRVASCPDVYRGLARVCGPGSRTPLAVIVCVDELGPGEMEFFSIVSRRRPGLPVYVYGRPRCEFRLTEAVGLGATGRVTEEAIRRLAPPDTTPLVSQTHPQPPAESVVADEPAALKAIQLDEQPAPRHQAPPGDSASADLGGGDAQADERFAADTSRGGEGSESQTGEARALELHPDEPQAVELEPSEPQVSESEPSEEQAFEPQPSEPQAFEPVPSEPQPSEQAARVPWLRYSDRPARTGPQKPPTPTPKEDPCESTPEGSPRALPEPLLTDEELRALIGEDDIAALAPEPGDPFPPTTPSGEGCES